MFLIFKNSHNNELSNISVFVLILFLTSTITTSLIIDWKLFFVWNAIKINYLKFGLSYNQTGISNFFFYWTFHYSPMHLVYVLLLFCLSLNGRDFKIRDLSLMLFATIFILPIIVYFVSYPIAIILRMYYSSFMLTSIKSRHYIGSSAIAWGYIGMVRRRDIFVGLAILFPFCYKLFVSHVFDFTPDIGHFAGYFLGYFFSKVIKD